MPTVSNTSPLSNLALIGRLDLVWEQFGSVIIPDAVLSELERIPHSAARRTIEHSVATGLLRVQTSAHKAGVQLLISHLHRGEAEAIALAAEMNADWLLIDEREGRAAARRLGLRMTGVLGILIRAKLQGRLGLLGPEIAKLRSEAHFFISPGLERQVLEAVAEFS